MDMWIGKLLSGGWLVPAALLGLLGLLAAQTLRLSGAKADLASAKADYAQQVANAATAARNTADLYRQLEGAHHEELAAADAQAHAQLDAAHAAAERAGAAAGLLQRDLSKYVAIARRAAADCAATGQCAPGSDPLAVLAHLQRSADATAGALAAVADDARIRGLACERAYDSARAMSAAAAPP